PHRVGGSIHKVQPGVRIVRKLKIAGLTAAGAEIRMQGSQRADDGLWAAVEVESAERALALVEAVRHVVEHPLGAAGGMVGKQPEHDGRLVEGGSIGVEGFCGV